MTDKNLNKYATRLVNAFLKMDTIWDLLYTILVIAIVPAIGEELFFRGYLQQKFSNWLASPHIAILIISFFFSAIHLDLQGLIPRFFLGSLLATRLSRNSSAPGPLILHFANALMSSNPTFSETFLHSLPICSNHAERLNDQSSSWGTPSGANQFALSQPNF